MKKKFFYRKCPNCGKYGIYTVGLNEGFLSTPSYCKYCNKKYKVNTALSLFSIFFILVFIIIIYLLLDKLFNLFPKHNDKLDLVFFIILYLIISSSVERIIPLEEIEEIEENKDNIDNKL